MEYPEHDFNFEKIEKYLSTLKTYDQKCDYLNWLSYKLECLILDLKFYITVPNISVSEIENSYIRNFSKQLQFENYQELNPHFVQLLNKTETNTLLKINKLKEYLDHNSMWTLSSPGRIKKILWYGSYELLLLLFDLLQTKNFITGIDEKDFVKHFRFIGDLNIFLDSSDKILWCGYDNAFSILISMLSKLRLICNRSLYDQFIPHFVNNTGEQFKNLSRKTNAIETYGSTDQDILFIIDSLKVYGIKNNKLN